MLSNAKSNLEQKMIDKSAKNNDKNDEKATENDKKFSVV